MNERLKKALNTILETFKSGSIPGAVAMATFPVPDTPSACWSFTNRTLMFISGTSDARGFRQWKSVGRWVRKGARAIYILVPCLGKEVDDDTGEEKEVLRYFKPSPVFMYEDTDGEPLEREQIELPEFPLIERANEWGVSVKAVPGNYLYAGYYSSVRNEIGVASPEEMVFFHELAHVGHEKVKGKLKSGQDPFQEIVAELSAQALCRLVGKSTSDTTGNSFQYIEKYADKLNLSPYIACLRVLRETEKVLGVILNGEAAIKAN